MSDAPGTRTAPGTPEGLGHGAASLLPEQPLERSTPQHRLLLKQLAASQAETAALRHKAAVKEYELLQSVKKAPAPQTILQDHFRATYTTPSGGSSLPTQGTDSQTAKVVSPATKPPLSDPVQRVVGHAAGSSPVSSDRKSALSSTRRTRSPEVATKPGQAPQPPPGGGSSLAAALAKMAAFDAASDLTWQVGPPIGSPARRGEPSGSPGTSRDPSPSPSPPPAASCKPSPARSVSFKEGLNVKTPRQSFSSAFSVQRPHSSSDPSTRSRSRSRSGSVPMAMAEDADQIIWVDSPLHPSASPNATAFSADIATLDISCDTSEQDTLADTEVSAIEADQSSFFTPASTPGVTPRTSFSASTLERFPAVHEHESEKFAAILSTPQQTSAGGLGGTGSAEVERLRAWSQMSVKPMVWTMSPLSDMAAGSPPPAEGPHRFAQRSIEAAQRTLGHRPPARAGKSLADVAPGKTFDFDAPPGSLLDPGASPLLRQYKSFRQPRKEPGKVKLLSREEREAEARGNVKVYPPRRVAKAHEPYTAVHARTPSEAKYGWNMTDGFFLHTSPSPAPLPASTSPTGGSPYRGGVQLQYTPQLNKKFGWNVQSGFAWDSRALVERQDHRDRESAATAELQGELQAAAGLLDQAVAELAAVRGQVAAAQHEREAAQGQVAAIRGLLHSEVAQAQQDARQARRAAEASAAAAAAREQAARREAAEAAAVQVAAHEAELAALHSHASAAQERLLHQMLATHEQLVAETEQTRRQLVAEAAASRGASPEALPPPPGSLHAAAAGAPLPPPPAYTPLQARGAAAAPPGEQAADLQQRGSGALAAEALEAAQPTQQQPPDQTSHFWHSGPLQAEPSAQLSPEGEALGEGAEAEGREPGHEAPVQASDEASGPDAEPAPPAEHPAPPKQRPQMISRADSALPLRRYEPLAPSAAILPEAAVPASAERQVQWSTEVPAAVVQPSTAEQLEEEEGQQAAGAVHAVAEASGAGGEEEEVQPQSSAVGRQREEMERQRAALQAEADRQRLAMQSQRERMADIEKAMLKQKVLDLERKRDLERERWRVEQRERDLASVRSENSTGVSEGVQVDAQALFENEAALTELERFERERMLKADDALKKLLTFDPHA